MNMSFASMIHICISGQAFLMADEVSVDHILRRSKRKRQQPDYRQLHNGPELPAEKVASKKWSTTKLFELVIIDSKFVGDRHLVKVHYTDEEWSAPSFDSWRDANDIIDIPNCYVHCTDELRAQFFQKLKTAIKEALHGQRKIDSKVNIELQIPKALFEELSCLGRKTKKSFYELQSLADLSGLLGEDWHWRIFNHQGDFAFVTPGTVTFWQKERKPLEQYRANGTLEFIHRGFHFHVQFVRGIGNRFDFQQFLDS